MWVGEEEGCGPGVGVFGSHMLRFQYIIPKYTTGLYTSKNTGSAVVVEYKSVKASCFYPIIAEREIHKQELLGWSNTFSVTSANA